MCVAANSLALPIYKKNRTASLLCIFETTICGKTMKFSVEAILFWSTSFAPRYYQSIVPANVCSRRHEQTTFSAAFFSSFFLFFKRLRVNICCGARKNPLIETVLLSTTTQVCISIDAYSIDASLDMRQTLAPPIINPRIRLLDPSPMKHCPLCILIQLSIQVI